MTFIKRSLFAVLLLGSTICSAQVSLPVASNFQAAYAKGTRNTSGEPGKNYWQNSARYTIKVKLDPATRNLSGTVNIDYVNNSPDTLKQIVFKLYPNLYKRGNKRNMAVGVDDIGDGVNISSMVIDQKPADAKGWNIQGTNMIVKVQPVAPGKHVSFDIAYNYTINKGSHIRTGQVDEGSFFIAYFFPRIAVYDDIDGWNVEPYLGTQEFYNDFCHFDAEITVPGDYEVWATGNQTNINEVFSKDIADRIAKAATTDSVTDVITGDDQSARNITLNKTANTWKFSADSVTDLAFATANHYIWKAAGVKVDPATGRRTRVDAVFNPDHQSYFKVIDYARKTVQLMSDTFVAWPYPYPHETVFDGLDQMEYPMMVNDNPVENPEDDIELTDHEIFHTMFPFYMGVNETKYAWMDEGWATIAEWLISPMIDPKIKDLYGMPNYEGSAGQEADVPIMTLSTIEEGTAYMTNSYPKPAMGYLYIRDLLGPEKFNQAVHEYINRWHGKHPIPFDFFNCMNAAAGTNLNWFWKNWFFDRGTPDQAITAATRKADGQGYTIAVANKGTKFMPVDVKVTYQDGSTEMLHRAVDCWKNGEKSISIDLKTRKLVKKLVLGEIHTPDVNKSNNTLTIKN